MTHGRYFRLLLRTISGCSIYSQEVMGLTSGQVAIKWLFITWLGGCLRTDKPFALGFSI